MTKASAIFSSFLSPDDFDTTGDIAIDEANQAQVDNVDKVIIRANDFKDSGGGSDPMPVIEYPAASGKYVGNPNNGKDYYYDLPSAVFGNYHSLMIEGLVVDTFFRPKSQMISIHPRDGSYFQELLTASVTQHEINMIDGGGKAWLFDNVTANKKIYKVNEWFKWQLDCIGKYFIENKITGCETGSGDLDMAHLIYRGQFDGYLANDTTPRGLVRTSSTQYTQGNSYFRSPGKEYEDTNNPAILQLWPFVSGFATYKNIADRYIEFTTEMVAAIIAGTFEANMLNMPQNTSRYLCTVRINGKIDWDPLWAFLVREDSYNLGDGIIYGGYCKFPDNPEFKPFRIVTINPGATNQLWTFHDVSQAFLDKIDAGEDIRCDIYINTIVPFFTGFPIPSGAILLPQPLSGSLYDIRNFQSDPPSVGDKITYGIYLNNLDGIFAEDDKFCKELVYMMNPKPVDIPSTPTVTIVNDGTGTSFTATIDGDSGIMNYLYYRRKKDEEWTLGGSRSGDGEIQVTGITGGIYKVVVVSKDIAVCSDISDEKSIFVFSNVDPIRERIVKEIKSTLESITELGGYNNTVENVERWKKNIEITVFPSIVLSVGSGDFDPKQYNAKYETMHIGIDFWLQTDDEDLVDEKANLAFADVDMALMEDGSRSGLARYTEVKRLASFWAPKMGRGGIKIAVDVEYGVKYDNPYEGA